MYTWEDWHWSSSFARFSIEFAVNLQTQPNIFNSSREMSAFASEHAGERERASGYDPRTMSVHAGLVPDPVTRAIAPNVCTSSK